MTETIHDQPLHTFRLLVIGGFTGTMGAIFMSICIVVLEMVTRMIIGIWQVGFASTFQVFVDGSFLERLFSLLLVVLVVISLSFVPAFIGGVLLAWLLNHEAQRRSILLRRILKLGAIVGAVSGTVLALIFIYLIYTVQATAHGGYGFQLSEAIPIYIFRGSEIIIASSITGTWAADQLRRRIYYDAQ
jgi:hypothetical protein